MEIWEVRCDVDSYASVVLKGEYPLYEGVPVSSSSTSMQGTFTESEPVGDFVYLTAGVLVASGRVIGMFSEKLRSELQIIPIDIGNNEFYILNITNLVDALDEERSSIKYFPSSRRVYRILSYVFKKENLRDVCLFKIPQLARTDIYATSCFKDFVEKEQLTGLLFKNTE